MNGNEIWDHLKKSVLLLSGIESVEPKDCGRLSILIAKETSKNISETTLKRIFGFAVANFEPSLYTRNILAQYCGHANWDSYIVFVFHKARLDGDKEDGWVKIKKETNKVNFFMLEAVKNKAVIPFHEMTDRKFIHRHFLEFDLSERLATVISAPTGYGKTIAICQWLTRKSDLKNGKDITLYLNSAFLLSSVKTIGNLNYWMMKMVGLAPAHDFQELLLHHKDGNGKFYFVIDGFDELMFRKNQFEVLSHLLLDILSIYKFSHWFKIVVVMRDSTWLNWKKQLMNDPSCWFLGEMNDHGQNVGLLTAKELSGLLQMDRPFTPEELSAKDFEKLRFPLFHLYYYKKYNSIIQYQQFNEILLFELATDYMNQNIIYGNQVMNKMDLIFYLLTLTEYVAGVYKVDKSRVQLHQKGFLNTYSILVQIGFIWEKEDPSIFNRHVYIQFIHLHFLGCCIAAFIFKDGSNFSLMKLEYIQQRWNEDPNLKINVLKWCLFLNISSGKWKAWIDGYHLYLSLDDLKTIGEFISTVEIKANLHH